MAKKQERCIVVSFHTSSDAFAFESLCKAQKVDGRLITIPRELSASCGLAWRSAYDCKEDIDIIVSKGTIDVEGVHTIVLPG